MKRKKVVTRIKNVFYKPKKQSQYFEVLFERVLVNEIKNSFKIEGSKNKTYIPIADLLLQFAALGCNPCLQQPSNTI